MSKISKESIKFLKFNIANFEKYTDVNDLLDEIDNLIIRKGFTKNQEFLNDFGIQAQKVYDDVFDNY